MADSVIKTKNPRIGRQKGILWVHINGRTLAQPTASGPATATSSSATQALSTDGKLRAPMPGKVLILPCKEKTTVTPGQTLCVLEAMKMEYHVTAPFDGVIHTIHCQVGQQVELGALLIEVRA